MEINERVICHIDLDAFYCQVEHVRLGIPIDVPLCVQQWNGLIATNVRHCTVEDARQKCPEVQLVHVATYMQGESEPKYNPNPLFSTHKVSLDVYRSASAKILQIMKRFCSKIERASIDEAYFDLTDELGDKVSWKDVVYDSTVHGDVLGSSVGFPSTVLDYKLYKAAELVKRVRDTVFAELGYTCSAGISVNKTLAKLCSSMHKPNRQTILRLEDARSFVSSLPLSKIRLLGGKLGAQVTSELNCELAGEVCQKPVEDLMRIFGNETGTWLIDVCRGICREEVIEREKVGSMGSCKSFRPFIEKWEDLNEWVVIISSELYSRVTEDYALNKRWPKTMNIVYRSGAEEKSKSFPFLNRIHLETVACLTAKIYKVIDALKDDMIPCSRLAVHLNQFEKCDESKSLLSYYKRVEKSTTSFWCRDCHKEIDIAIKGEHEDYHFALKLEEKVVSNASEKQDFEYAMSLQEEGVVPAKKRTKITDYFSRV